MSLSGLSPGVRVELWTVFSQHLLTPQVDTVHAEGAVFNNATVIWQKLFNLDLVIFNKQCQFSVTETIAYLPRTII